MTTRRQRSESTPPASSLPGYSFQRPELLTWALTHRSLSYEANPDHASLLGPENDNEQLEFLGDAVLGLVIAESLFRRFPALREGELTRMRASLVSRRHLGGVAAEMNLGALLLLGWGEEQSGGRAKPALLANAMEAVIAAVYLDGGLDAAREFIESRILEPAMPTLRSAINADQPFSEAIGDHKSALQEFLQAAGAGQPQYVLKAQTGPDHQRRFLVEVRVGDGGGGTRALAESEGTTKKQAQQEAARIAFERLLRERDAAGALDSPDSLDSLDSLDSPAETSG